MTLSLHVRMVLLALASAPALASPADPLDAQAATQPLAHRSAFDGYRRITGDAAVSWRDANDTVRRIGGWRSYAREAAAAPPAAAAASAPGATPPMRAEPPNTAPAHKH